MTTVELEDDNWGCTAKMQQSLVKLHKESAIIKESAILHVQAAHLDADDSGEVDEEKAKEKNDDIKSRKKGSDKASKQKIESLQRENKKLQDEELKKQINAQEEEIKRLKAEIEEEQENVDRVEKEKRKLKAELNKKDGEITILSHKLELCENDQIRILKANNQLYEENMKQQSQIKNLKEQINNLQQDVAKEALMEALMDAKCDSCIVSVNQKKQTDTSPLLNQSDIEQLEDAFFQNYLRHLVFAKAAEANITENKAGQLMFKAFKDYSTIRCKCISQKELTIILFLVTILVAVILFCMTNFVDFK